MAIFREYDGSDLSLDNPIARAERDHLHRKLELQRGSRWRLWTGIVCVIGTLILTNRLVDIGFFRTLPGAVEVYGLLILTAIMGILHFGVMIRTLSMSAETFVREKRGGTWESLVLTSTGARRLVLGKSWGVMCIVWKDYVWLALLRASLIVALGAILAAQHGVTLFDMQSEPVQNAWLYMLLAWILSFALTMMNMVLTVMSGVAGSLFGRVHAPSLSTGQSARLLALVVPIVLLLLPVVILIPLQNEQISYHGLLLVGGTQLSLIDNGMIFMASLANPYDPQGLIYVVVGVLTLMVYGVLTFALLRLAQNIAVRQGAVH